MKQIIANTGFVTNSSSQICWFDSKVLENEKVKAFMATFGIENGYVGEELWRRDTCGSVILTKAQKEDANMQLEREDYGGGIGILPTESDVVLIYGDEYAGDIAYILAQIIREVQKDAEKNSTEFN